MSEPASVARLRDPLPASRFTLVCDGVPVAGVIRVSALQMTGSGGATTIGPVTVSRAAGTDDLFHAWARAAFSSGDQPARTVVVTLVDGSGATAAGWHLVGAVPVAYSPVSELDALSAGAVIETLTLAVTDLQPAG